MVFLVYQFLIFRIKTTLGATGIWIGLLSGLTASAILLYLRFNYLTKKLISNL